MRLPDLLTVLGVILLVGGVALVHIPTAMIVAGGLVVVAGERASTRDAGRSESDDRRSR